MANYLDFTQRLSVYLRSMFPLLVVDTVEEKRLMQVINTVGTSMNMRVLSWDTIDGFTDLSNSRSLAPTTDIFDVITRLQAMSPGTVVVLKDVHHEWEEPRVQRALRNYAERDGMRGCTAVIVGAGTLPFPPSLKDAAVAIDFPPPSRDDLRGALEEVLTATRAKRQLNETETEHVIDAALGLTVRQARRVFTRAAVSDGVMDISDIDLILEEKRSIIAASGALEYIPPNIKIDDVGGLENLKEWLRVRAKGFTKRARDFGVPAPKGIVLIGLPGTGKSLTAKAIATLWGLPLLRLDVGALYSSYLGRSEQQARDALATAEAIAPCVVWIDEIEKAVSDGGDHDSGTSTRVLGTLLTWMNERSAPVFVVATANNAEKLPPEILRRGRFDEIFFLDMPSFVERADILSVHLRRSKRDPAEYDVNKIAETTDGFVGSEIEQLVMDGLMYAFDNDRELTTEDLLKSAADTVPLSVAQRERVARMRQWLTQGRAKSASQSNDGWD